MVCRGVEITCSWCDNDPITESGDNHGISDERQMQSMVRVTFQHFILGNGAAW